MISYTTTILRFEKQGEKTGWTYIEVPEDIAQQLNPGNKKSFRVKGKLDDHSIKQIALLPMGNGNFIMPLNAALRKAIGKRKGAMLKVQLTIDKVPYEINAEFLECLDDEPAAMEYYKSMTMSFQHYYSKWIETAKTEPTRTKRIALAVSSLARKMDFGEMLRSQKKMKDL
ncbi:MAG: YdeI/OmpD-associated family protein [Ferruginibacter sp.]